MNERDYPAPSYAASIWTAGENIHMTLPPVYGQERGHSVIFPNKPEGWLAIAMILRDRETKERSRSIIGTAAAPTQWDIDIVLKAMKAGKTVTHVQAVRKVKFNDDITLDDLELDMEDLASCK